MKNISNKYKRVFIYIAYIVILLLILVGCYLFIYLIFFRWKLFIKFFVFKILFDFLKHSLKILNFLIKVLKIYSSYFIFYILKINYHFNEMIFFINSICLGCDMLLIFTL